MITNKSEAPPVAPPITAALLSLMFAKLSVESKCVIVSQLQEQKLRWKSRPRIKEKTVYALLKPCQCLIFSEWYPI